MNVQDERTWALLRAGATGQDTAPEVHEVAPEHALGRTLDDVLDDAVGHDLDDVVAGERVAGKDAFNRRARCLYVLAKRWPDHPDLPALTGELACAPPDDDVRAMAAEIVRRWAADEVTVPKAISAVIAANDESSGEPWASGGLNDVGELVRILGEAWRGDPARFVSMAALVEPPPSGSTDSVPYAVETLRDCWSDDPRLRSLLERTATGHPVADARSAALEALTRQWPGDPAVGRLIIRRSIDEPDERVRGQAVRLVRLRWSDHPAAVDALSASLAVDGSPTARREALQALTRKAWSPEGSGHLLPRLVAALDDPDPEVRTVALDAFYDWAPPGTVDADRLFAHASAEQEPIPRVAALRAAVRHTGTSKAALARIADLLRDGDPDVQLAAMRGLGHLGPAPIRMLAKELRTIGTTGRPWVRRVALSLLRDASA